MHTWLRGRPPGAVMVWAEEVNNHLISALGLEGKSARASLRLQRWFFSTPQWYHLGLLELAALSWAAAHLNPALLSPGWVVSSR